MLLEKMPTYSGNMGEDWMKVIPKSERRGMRFT